MNIRNDHIAWRIQHLTACLLFLLLCMIPAYAQPGIMKFDRISSEQGLSDNFVMCMLQDRQGLIWLGTRDGLNRYDGYNFKVYRADIHDPGSISDGAVDHIIEDREGRLWLGLHDGGLNRFDRTTGRFIHFTHNPADTRSITAGSIMSLCEQGGYVWVVSDGPGPQLCRIDKKTGKATRYRHSPENHSSISGDTVTAVARDRFGTVWVGTSRGGLNRFDTASGSFVNDHTNRLYAPEATGRIDGLYTDTTGALWFWSPMCIRRIDLDGANGLCRRAIIDSIQQPQGNLIFAVYHDRSGALWVGGTKGGAGILKSGARELIHAIHNPSDPQSIGSDRIYCIMEDRSGNVWLGTDNGVSRLNRRNWYLQYYQRDPSDTRGLPYKVVRSITMDHDGDLWMATEHGGLNRIAASSGIVTPYLHNPRIPSSLNDNITNVVREDSRGYMWVGTNSGLARFDRKTGTFRRYDYGPSDGRHVPHRSVWSVLEDRDGGIWIGTFGGLCRLDTATDRFTYYFSGGGDATGPVFNRILSLYEDRSGNIWVGTDEGLSILNKKTQRWRHYVNNPRDTSSLSNGRIWYIHEDNDGIFWLATSGGGMEKFDPRTGIFRHITGRDGLAGNIVCGILEDDYNRLWISTTQGLSVLDKRKRKIRSYSLQDGFYVNEFHFKSCFKDAHGYMYFGGNDGVVKFHPGSMGDNALPPDIVLTSLSIFNNERVLDIIGLPAQEIELEYDSNFFSFDFAAMDFTNPQRNHYWYYLDGVDSRWREADGRYPRADYTNVPPGDYVFRVQGSNSDGIRNTTGASIRVIVRPAYWQTWWFAGIMMALAGAATAVLARRHIRRIRRQGMLERKLVEYQLKALRAQMNPHFIFNSLNSILLFMLDHDVESAYFYLTRFSKLMRATLEHSKNEMVPLGEELKSLQWYLDLEALRLDHAFTYAIDISPEIDIDDVMIPPMLMQPYAENAIKHGLKPAGPGGILSIDIRLETEWIICSITDNGIGRKSAAIRAQNGTAHRSRGMEVTRERLEILSSLSRQCYGLDVVDLTGEGGAPLGTQVNIRIPVSPYLHHTGNQRGVRT